MMNRRPGGELSSRPLHFIFITDCSGSMQEDGKISSLNLAIKEAIPHMQAVAEENPNAQVLVRAVKFSDTATWHIADPTPIKDFKWEDLSSGGLTSMGKALELVASQLKIPPMTERALPPVLVLISDGQPTDEFESGLSAIMELPWGKKSVRLSIAIGRDADMDILQRFIGNKEIKPLSANNPEQLIKYIRFVSTEVLKSVSSPPSVSADEYDKALSNIVIPQVLDDEDYDMDVNDIW